MSVAIRTATRIQDQDDFGSTPGAGNDGYALVWDNGAGEFVLAAAGVTDHGALTGLSDDDHSQYLLATGARTGASSQAQAFTSGVVTSAIKPASDSTTALQLQNAAGAPVLNVNTSDGLIAIKTTSTSAERLSINTAHDNYAGIVVKANSATQTGYFASFKNSANTAVVFITGHGTGQANGLITALNSTPTDPSASAISSGANFGMNATPTNFYGMGLGALRNSRYDMWFQTGATNGGGYRFYIAGVTEAVTIDYTGRMGIGTTSPATKLHALTTDTATNAVTNVVTVGHNTSGTAAAGLGAGLLYQLESSTTAAQDAARIQALWYEATHATRKADLVLTAYDTAEREGLRIRGAGSAPAIGFYGVTPIERATLATGAGASVDHVITALQNLGLVKQS